LTSTTPGIATTSSDHQAVVTAADRHYATGAEPSELLGSAQALRGMIRQLATQLLVLAEHAPDRAVRIALEDAAGHEQRSCNLLTTVLAALDPETTPARRQHSRLDLDEHARC
jgi:hypothetical protein